MDNTNIKVRCRTNIDKFKNESWPQIMACRPLKGDGVLAASGVILYVVGVTHVDRKQCDGHGIKHDPQLILELHRYYWS